MDFRKGHDNYTVIDSQLWSNCERFVMFRYFGISFQYCNDEGNIVDFPYKVASLVNVEKKLLKDLND